MPNRTLSERTDRRPSLTRVARVSVTGLLLVGVLGLAVAGSTMAIAQRGSEFRFFDPLIDVKVLIEQYAAEKPDDEALQTAAIEGMLGALDDPYASYVPADLQEDFQKDLTGEYVGIGAEVRMDNGALLIVSPLDDSPAFNAGVIAGDRVIAIDGQSTEDMLVDEAISLLKGEPETPVDLTIERGGPGDTEVVEITVIRDEIKTRSVRGFHRDRTEEGRWEHVIDRDRGIMYLRLSRFTPESSREVRDALLEAGAADGEIGGLVLDLRWNPGGLLSEAIAIADLFLEDGVIVSTRGRAFPERVAEATRPGTLPGFPIALLVNSQSASASEVLAGALVENGRAIAVGERTFGKGSVQSVRTLGGSAAGSVLKITEQKYYLPSGRSLQRSEDSAEWGVDPSPGFFVPLDDEETREMLRIRREQEILRTGPEEEDGAPGRAMGDWSDPDWILENLKDRQLATAVRAVQAHADAGDWPQTEAEALPYDAVTVAELSRLERGRERLLRELERLERRIGVLGEAAGDAAELAAEEYDLWADDVEVEGGTIEVRDADGNIVSELRITGRNIERWLIDAGVKPLAGSE